MKRKLISLLAVIALLIATAVPTFASSDSVIETEVQHFADGSYAVIETVIESQVSLCGIFYQDRSPNLYIL